MAHGQVIKMHDGSFNTPNKGVVMDLETGLQYAFSRESCTSATLNWNVKLYDVVTFTIDGSNATGVTLHRKHLKGVVYSYSSDSSSGS